MLVSTSLALALQTSVFFCTQFLQTRSCTLVLLKKNWIFPPCPLTWTIPIKPGLRPRKKWLLFTYSLRMSLKMMISNDVGWFKWLNKLQTHDNQWPWTLTISSTSSLWEHLIFLSVFLWFLHAGVVRLEFVPNKVAHPEDLEAQYC